MWIITKAWRSVRYHQQFLIIKHLADHGADLVHYRKANGSTALHAAAALGHLKIFTEIHARGADLNSRVVALSSDDSGPFEGQTPLIIAACNGHLDLVQYCLQAAHPVHQVSQDTRVLYPP